MARLKEIFSPLNTLSPVTGRRAFKQKMWPCPSPSAAIQKADPASSPGQKSRAGPVGVSVGDQTQGCESRRIRPTFSCMIYWVSYPGQYWRAHVAGDDDRKLAGWPTQL